MSKKRVFLSGDAEQLKKFNLDFVPDIEQLHLVVPPGAGKTIYKNRVLANYIKHHGMYHLKLVEGGAGFSFFISGSRTLA